MIDTTPSRSIGKLGAILLLGLAPLAHADEGGVSFWLPGQFGSLAAVPTTPGWALGTVYYHTSVDESAAKSFPIGGNVAAGIDADANLVFVAPTYTFATPVAGGQAALGVIYALGKMSTTADVELSGPNGNTIRNNPADDASGGSDLYALGTLKWNEGVNNYMVYTMWGAPVGAYEEGRLANIGTNHWSFDAGGGYTYLNPKTRFEASIVGGLTYSLENPDTDYQNGVDGHLDFAISQFLPSMTTHIGLAGYWYNQLEGDHGSGASLGDFKSRVAALGPQIGHFFVVSGQKWYVNTKVYFEFEAKNRPEGWNAWLQLLIPLSAEPAGK